MVSGRLTLGQAEDTRYPTASLRNGRCRAPIEPRPTSGHQPFNPSWPDRCPPQTPPHVRHVARKSGHIEPDRFDPVADQVRNHPAFRVVRRSRAVGGSGLDLAAHRHGGCFLPRTLGLAAFAQPGPHLWVGWVVAAVYRDHPGDWGGRRTLHALLPGRRSPTGHLLPVPVSLHGQHAGDRVVGQRVGVLCVLGRHNGHKLSSDRPRLQCDSQSTRGTQRLDCHRRRRIGNAGRLPAVGPNDGCLDVFGMESTTRSRRHWC